MQVQTEIVFPIVYGSMAFSMGTKKTQLNTHKWICYVRGVNNQDLSYLIRKVQFILHQSFDQPVKRIYLGYAAVDKPPFQVKKQGWGEFQIKIRIYFQHPTMPYVEVPHMLKLHHSHTSGAQASKKPLCSQVYDEIVFTQMDVLYFPNTQHIQKMIKGRQKAQKLQPNIQIQNSADEIEPTNPDQPLKSIGYYTKYLTEIKHEEFKNKLEDALKFIIHQIKTSEEKMRNADTDLQKVYDQIYSKFP